MEPAVACMTSDKRLRGDMFPPAQSRSHILRTGAKPRERNNTILRRAFGEAGSVRKDYLTGSVPCTPHEGSRK